MALPLTMCELLFYAFASPVHHQCSFCHSNSGILHFVSCTSFIMRSFHAYKHVHLSLFKFLTKIDFKNSIPEEVEWGENGPFSYHMCWKYLFPLYGSVIWSDFWHFEPCRKFILEAFLSYQTKTKSSLTFWTQIHVNSKEWSHTEKLTITKNPLPEFVRIWERK